MLSFLSVFLNRFFLKEPTMGVSRRFRVVFPRVCARFFWPPLSFYSFRGLLLVFSRWTFPSLVTSPSPKLFQTTTAAPFPFLDRACFILLLSLVGVVWDSPDFSVLPAVKKDSFSCSDILPYLYKYFTVIPLTVVVVSCPDGGSPSTHVPPTVEEAQAGEGEED